MLWCKAHKISSILCYVLWIHCLFIICYTETERVPNEKFKQEAWPFRLSETAILHTLGSDGFCRQSCVVGETQIYGGMLLVFERCVIVVIRHIP